jgi:DNA-binding GntR family transcriptional regulator
MSAVAIDDIQRSPPLAEQVYERLRHRLRTGAFAPGERLIDAGLAQNLAVSRTPVREALSRLAADGLLETRGGGFQVMRPTLADMEEIFEIRRLIEPPAARQAATRMTPAAREALTRALAQARDAARAEAFTPFAEANYAFRAAWVAQLPNRRLRETILRFDDQAGLVRRATLVLPKARAEALALLERLAKAFAKGDAASAAALTERFIDAAAKFFRQTVEHAGPGPKR